MANSTAAILVAALLGVLAGFSLASAAPTSVANDPEPPSTETIDLGEGVKMEFVLIRPGTFVMGSDSHQSDERAAHQVTLTQPFYLGKFEVTQAQWERVMGANPSHFKGANLPVDNVSWEDCQHFLAALRKKIGRRFALPTEAQWEYACRAGSTSTYSWGEDEAGLTEQGWYAGNSQLTTHPVGQKKPNRWGLHDMHGNVAEWCADWYSEGPYAACGALDPRGPRSGFRRVIRGGAWLFVADNLRSSDRGFSPPDFRINEYGLRCALLVGEEKPDHEGETQKTPLVENFGALDESLVVDLGSGASMEFVLIRPGTFTMGSDASPLANEKPAHRVSISRPFYLGKHEVTQGQWAALMSHNPSAFGGDMPREAARLPVENVSWELCRSFLEKLNATFRDRRFRLPTEAEWEYACRAGSAGERHCEDNALDDYAWHGSNAENRTHVVGAKRPNAWGLHDMYGNVWEWCEDRYGPYAAEAVSDPKAPVSSAFASTRVLRGGAWNNTAQHVRSGFRFDEGQSVMTRYYGFRCVALVAAKKPEETR